MTAITVYAGKDNSEDWVLSRGAAVLTDLSAITRVQLKVGAVTVDSATAPAGTLTWDEQATVNRAMAAADASGQLARHLWQSIDVLRLRLGQVDTLAAGTYPGSCLIVYDADHTDGLVWADDLIVTVKSC